jgi:hypothetical protein
MGLEHTVGERRRNCQRFSAGVPLRVLFVQSSGEREGSGSSVMFFQDGQLGDLVTLRVPSRARDALA